MNKNNEQSARDGGGACRGGIYEHEKKNSQNEREGVRWASAPWGTALSSPPVRSTIGRSAGHKYDEPSKREEASKKDQ